MLLQRRFKLNSWSSWCALGHCATCYGTSERVVSSKLVQHTHTPSAKFGREPPLHRSQRCRRPPRSHRPREALHALVHRERPIMKAVQPSHHPSEPRSDEPRCGCHWHQPRFSIGYCDACLSKLQMLCFCEIKFPFVTLAGVETEAPPHPEVNQF